MLKLINLQKKYNSFTLNCSMEVIPGRITGFIGQNGAGKSTTFKSILGLISKDDGEITILGKDISDINEDDMQRIGVVLSDSGFSGYLSISDIIPILSQLYKQFDLDFFLKKCLQFNLPKNKKIKEFSTGMKAKLKIIIATSHHADLLILDEPTAGLDVLARDEVLDMLREYMEEDENRSILISSHISSDLENLCDDFYMIHEGQIILHEETDVLLSDYAIIKLNENQFNEIDKDYILKIKKESFGYSCLTNEKQFYLENYPKYVIERGNLDELILMMIRGVSL